VLFLDQSPAAADDFEQRTPFLFVQESLKSWIEVHAEAAASSLRIGQSRTRTVARKNQPSDLNALHKNDSGSISSIESFSDTEIVGDLDQHALQDVSKSGLSLAKISDEEQLKNFIKVRTAMIPNDETWLMQRVRLRAGRIAYCTCLGHIFCENKSAYTAF
jgi:hypothetical protein